MLQSALYIENTIVLFLSLYVVVCGGRNKMAAT